MDLQVFKYCCIMLNLKIFSRDSSCEYLDRITFWADLTKAKIFSADHWTGLTLVPKIADTIHHTMPTVPPSPLPPHTKTSVQNSAQIPAGFCMETSGLIFKPGFVFRSWKNVWLHQSEVAAWVCFCSQISASDHHWQHLQFYPWSFDITIAKWNKTESHQCQALLG